MHYLDIKHPNHVWASDNIYIERFWKTSKYEDIYLYRYDTLNNLRKGLLKYFRFYHSVRPHQSLNENSPDEIYSGESNLKVALKLQQFTSGRAWIKQQNHVLVNNPNFIFRHFSQCSSIQILIPEGDG